MINIKIVTFFFLVAISNISMAICGDGIKEKTEECDLGPDLNGDNELSGCNIDCKIKVGWTCLQNDQEYHDVISKFDIFNGSLDKKSMTDLYVIMNRFDAITTGDIPSSNYAKANCTNTTYNEKNVQRIQLCQNYLEALNKFKQLNYSVPMSEAGISSTSTYNVSRCNSNGTIKFYQFNPINFEPLKDYVVKCTND